jgi:hypothetical protein
VEEEEHCSRPEPDSPNRTASQPSCC